MIYWQQKYKVTTKYTLEYITNRPEDVKRFKRASEGKSLEEPWEVYEERVYDSLDDAMAVYVSYLIRSSVEAYDPKFPGDSFYDVKLFEEIFIDGELVREAYIEPPSTFLYHLRQSVDTEYQQNINSKRREISDLTEQLDKINEFLQIPVVKKTYEKWKREEKI